jgi:hypothetical protein
MAVQPQSTNAQKHFQKSTQMNLEQLNPARTSRKAQDAIDHLALSAEVNARGAVFTRREVVDFILDLTGYKEDQPLHEKRLLAPSLSLGGHFNFSDFAILGCGQFRRDRVIASAIFSSAGVTRWFDHAVRWRRLRTESGNLGHDGAIGLYLVAP